MVVHTGSTSAAGVLRLVQVSPYFQHASRIVLRLPVGGASVGQQLQATSEPTDWQGGLLKVSLAHLKLKASDMYVQYIQLGENCMTSRPGVPWVGEISLPPPKKSYLDCTRNANRAKVPVSVFAKLNSMACPTANATCQLNTNFQR